MEGKEEPKENTEMESMTSYLTPTAWVFDAWTLGEKEVLETCMFPNPTIQPSNNITAGFSNLGRMHDLHSNNPTISNHTRSHSILQIRAG